MKMLEMKKNLSFSNDKVDVTIKTYDINAWNTIITALSARDYKLHEAIGEIVDNSVAAGFKNPKTGKIDPVEVDIEINKKRGIIRIRDNGHGQDSGGLAASMDYGKPSTKKVSRFGVGLKQSLPGLGRFIQIRSKKYGSEETHYYELDVDKVRENPKLLTECKNIISTYVDPLNSSKETHFFEVTISRLNELPTKSIIDYLKRELGHMFASYLSEGQLKIKVNTTTVALSPRPKLEKKESFNFPEKGISGWWGLVVRGLTGRTHDFGVDTYYNGRLITQNDLDINNAPNHPNFFRLEGEVHFNQPCVFDNNLTSSKNGWMRNKNYFLTKKFLGDVITKPYLRAFAESAKLYKKTKKYKKVEEKSVLAPKVLRKLFPSLRRPPSICGTPIKTREMVKESEETTKEKKPIKTRKPSGYLYLNGTRYQFQIIATEAWDSLSPRYAYEVNKEEQRITVTINMKNPFVKILTADMLSLNILEWCIESLLEILDFTKTDDFIREREELLIKQNPEKWIKEEIEEEENGNMKK